MSDSTELDALRAEVAALRAEVSLLKASQPVINWYPVPGAAPQPPVTPAYWPNGTALPPGWQWPGSGIWVNTCAVPGAADHGFGNVFFQNTTCAGPAMIPAVTPAR